MLIESIIKRDEHLTVQMDDESYVFTPDMIGRHVADVDDADHVDRFLAIPEGFRLAEMLPHQQGTGADDTVVLDRDTLVAEYTKVFGKPPHHRMSAANIAKIIAEDAQESAA